MGEFASEEKDKRDMGDELHVGGKVTRIGSELFVFNPNDEGSEVKASDDSESEAEVAPWAWMSRASAGAGNALAEDDGSSAMWNDGSSSLWSSAPACTETAVAQPI